MKKSTEASKQEKQENKTIKNWQILVWMTKIEKIGINLFFVGWVRLDGNLTYANNK